MHRTLQSILLAVTSSLLIFNILPSPSLNASDLTEQEIQDTATEAYLYLYPLVLMDVSRRNSTGHAMGTDSPKFQENQLRHSRAFPDAKFRNFVRPNFDTLYSIAWLDLSKGPLMLSTPDTGKRYYLIQLLDMWTDTFAVPGTRTTGNKAAVFAIIPPDWTGKIPDQCIPIKAPTPHIWLLGRIQTNGKEDYQNVNKLQDEFKLYPLNAQNAVSSTPPEDSAVPKIDSKIEPMFQVNRMPGLTFFSYATSLMKNNPPHLSDWSILARMKRIGLEAGKKIDSSDEVIRKALEEAPEKALLLMKAQQEAPQEAVNGWKIKTDLGVYGNSYRKRAVIAMIGIGANQPEDAIYPINIADADGAVPEGGKKYSLHFSKSEIPPVNAFWSITMYDSEGYQVPNSINRYAIGDRDHLKYNEDGSLDIYIQPDSPGKEKESNWLPAPREGRLGITMRLYAPKPAVLNRTWQAPPLCKH